MTNNAPQQPAPLHAADSPMSLEDTRRVTWPFDARQPMGTMLDQRSKLQWAAEKAKWPDVRRAAQILIEGLERQEAAPASPSSIPSMTAAPPAVAAAALPVAQLAPPALQSLPQTLAVPNDGARVVLASTYLQKQQALHGWMLV